MCFFIYQNNFAQFTDGINSNRPSESMSCFSVGKTIIQLETGAGHINQKHSLLDYTVSGYLADFTVRYGFFKEELETILDIKYQTDTYTDDVESYKRHGTKLTNLGFKYLFYDPFKNYEEKPNLYSWKANHKFKWHQLIPAVSGYVGMNMNFSDNSYTPKDPRMNNISPKAMVIAQNVFKNSVVMTTNIFYDKITTPYKTLGYIVTVSKAFGENLSLFVENKGIKGTYYSDGIFSAGFTYLVNEDLQLDASISKSYKDTPTFTYFGVGVSWRSATNHKDVLIRAPGADKNSGKSKGDKKKDKEKKKRLDEVKSTNP